MSVARGTWIVRIAAIAIVYALLARVGLALDPVGGFATVVWAPTGVAIAAVLLYGYGAAPGVWAGALVANLSSGASVTMAAAIGVGNALEAIVAVALLRLVRGFDAGLDGMTDVLVFVVVAAVIAPVVSASVGVAALVFSDVVARATIGETWRAWWVGDCIGALLVAPAILVWHARGWRDLQPRLAEWLAMLIALAAVASIVFFARTPLEQTSFLQAYLVFPVLIWAAMRFEQRGAVTALLLASILAIAGTARGGGPFVQTRLHDSLFVLQTFMGIMAISFLALGAAIAEREVASRTARQLLESLGVANRAKSDFLAAMSHELRTPLNAIGGYAQLLSMNVHGDLTTQQREAMQRIESNQRHLAALVDDVLSFTRVEQGRLTLNIVAVDVAESLAALTQFIGVEADRKGVTIDVRTSGEQLAVLADPERLRQVLLNLVVNAIKFSEAGTRIEVAAVRDDRQARISVRDRGIGIPPGQLERVFEPFFQVDRGHARRFGGVGLGLTISRDLARAMDGDIHLESEVGKGTTATVVLPLAPDSAQQPLAL